jgi:hypothetical protein
MTCMGPRLKIMVAFKQGKPLASILTLEHKNTVVYKYGCSDPASQNLGGTPFLLWKAIVDAKTSGATRLDLGRSDADNAGLIAFKGRWGAVSSELTYLRWSSDTRAGAARVHATYFLKQVFARMPETVLQAAGRLLYRHVG